MTAHRPTPAQLTVTAAVLAHEALANDWGTTAQIEAENALMHLAEDRLPTSTWEALESYCLKASTQERITEAVRLLRATGVTLPIR